MSSLAQRIRESLRTFLIAEIGSNHDGDMDQALRLMDIAAEAGSDAVKFQSFLADHLVPRNDPNYDMLKKLEMPQAWYARLKKEAADRGMVFFSTATNDITMGWLRDVAVEAYKIASPNLTHIPLIRKVAAMGSTAIMSTGMASLGEIDEAVQAYTAGGNHELCLLYCVSEYPAAPASLKLRNIQSLQAVYPYPVGFSDHTLDIGSSIAAVALGARLIEKHLTLDRALKGPDHHYALEPGEFLSMARNIRIVEEALGDGSRRITDSERQKATAYRRSLHAAKDLAAGALITEADLAVIRPDDGLHPREFDAVIGLRLKKALKAQAPFTWDHFKE